MHLCFKCTIKYAKEKSRCPYEGCPTKVGSSSEKIQLFQAILDSMFKEYSVDHDDISSPNASSGQTGGRLTIRLLTGESIDVPYNASMEILELKHRIMQQLKHDIGKQKLLYKEKEMTVRKRTSPLYNNYIVV